MSGKYRVEHVLGEGGMGIVVAARHLELKELYAIKVMKREALGGDAFAERRFIGEARAAARLKGEHVARVHDIGRLDTGELYMVMEHLKGTDLKKVVRKRGPLPLEEAITYVLQTCEAIAEAHALDIIHRDIKPHNLFLTEGGNSIKVLDFGISKQATAEGPDLTGTHVMLGTLSYMSPEQMEHSKRVDARSDVWSIGVVFYELVTGEIPFPGQGVLEIFAQISQGGPRPPSQLQPGLPAGVDAVVARCLQSDPAQRFGSVNELALVLRSLIPSPSAGAARSIVRLSPVASLPVARPPGSADAAFSVDSAPPASSASEARTTKKRKRSVVEKPAPVFHLTGATTQPEPRTETSNGTTLPVKASRRRARWRWRWAIWVGACGLVVLALVAFQRRLPRPAVTSQTSQETHEAGSDVVVPPSAALSSATVLQPEADMQEPGPSVFLPSATAQLPETRKQEPGPNANEHLPGGGKPGFTVKPTHRTPPPTDNKQYPPGSSTRCTDDHGTKFPFLVNVSARSHERRQQLKKKSDCWGDENIPERFCCVRPQVD